MLDKTDGFSKSDLDSEVEGRLADHCARFAIDPLTAVKHFPVLARRQLLKRFLAHVELFKLGSRCRATSRSWACSAGSACSPGRTCSRPTASAIAPRRSTASTIGRVSRNSR